MDTQTPDNSLIRFLRSKAAIPVGFILAIALGIFLMLRGLCNSSACCGMGALIVAILMFFIVKLFNGKSTKLLVIFAVLFFAASTLVGAFAFSSPFINDNHSYDDYESNHFSDLNVVYTNGDYVEISVRYSGEGSNVTVEFRELAWVSYQSYGVFKNEDNRNTYLMTNDGSGRYTASFYINKNLGYDFHFYSTNADGKTVDDSRNLFFVSDGFNQTMFCIQWNAYYAFLPSIIFVLIAIITLWLRKRLEKERKKMEADGRLYPEGYGRCKECGSIILPGEVSCRKCGAYVDVPANMRVKKTDSFYCTDCGAEVPSDARVCPKCGAKFDDDTETVVVDNNAQITEDAFQCTDCGAIVPADAKICPKCGAKFDEDEEPRRP